MLIGFQSYHLRYYQGRFPQGKSKLGSFGLIRRWGKTYGRMVGQKYGQKLDRRSEFYWNTYGIYFIRFWWVVRVPQSWAFQFKQWFQLIYHHIAVPLLPPLFVDYTIIRSSYQKYMWSHLSYWPILSLSR